MNTLLYDATSLEHSVENIQNNEGNTSFHEATRLNMK